MTYPPPSPEPGAQPGQPYSQPAPQPAQQPGQPSYPQAGQPSYPSGQPSYTSAQQPYPPAGQQPHPPYQQAYPQYPGAGGTPPRPRGRTPLRLSLVFGVVGLVLAIVGGVLIGAKSYSQVNGFSRVAISAGSGTAHFSSAGNYLAYYEASNVSSSINTVPLPAVALRSPSGKIQVLDTLYGGAPKSSGNISSTLTYDFNGHKGVAIYQFKVTQAGTYNVVVRGSGTEPPGADIAFGKSIGTDLAVGAGLLAPGILLIIVAVILLIIGLVQRSNSRKQFPPAHYGAPGYGYPPPPQQPQAQQPQAQQPQAQQPQAQQQQAQQQQAQQQQAEQSGMWQKPSS